MNENVYSYNINVESLSTSKLLSLTLLISLKYDLFSLLQYNGTAAISFVLILHYSDSWSHEGSKTTYSEVHSHCLA
jgi:hypothetical protein